MNLEQLIDEINKDLDDTIENAELIGWINRCIDDLSPIAQAEGKIDTDLSSDNQYFLPDEVQQLKLVVVNGYPYKLLPVSDLYSAGYKVWNRILSLQYGPDGGVLEVYYQRPLAHVEKMEDVPEIDTSFHDLFVLYTVAKARYQDEEESLQANAWNEYQARKSAFQAFMREQQQIDTIQTTYSM